MIEPSAVPIKKIPPAQIKKFGFICMQCGSIIKDQHCPHCSGLPFGILFQEE